MSSVVANVFLLNVLARALALSSSSSAPTVSGVKGADGFSVFRGNPPCSPAAGRTCGLQTRPPAGARRALGPSRAPGPGGSRAADPGRAPGLEPGFRPRSAAARPGDGATRRRGHPRVQRRRSPPMRPREAAGGQAIEGNENGAHFLPPDLLLWFSIVTRSPHCSGCCIWGHPLIFFKVPAPVFPPGFRLIYSMQSKWERSRDGKLYIFISFVSKVSSLKKKKVSQEFVDSRLFKKIKNSRQMDNFKNYQIIAVILLITSQVFTFVTPPPPMALLLFSRN